MIKVNNQGKIVSAREMANVAIAALEKAETHVVEWENSIWAFNLAAKALNLSFDRSQLLKKDGPDYDFYMEVDLLIDEGCERILRERRRDQSLPAIP